MSTDLARDVAAVICAIGVVIPAAPIPRVSPTLRRAGGLALVVAGWLALAVTLIPADDVNAVGDRLRTPAGIVAGLVVAAAAVAVAVLGVRILPARPVVWFALLGVALPLRVPVPLGGETRNLLLPLYVMIAVGVLAWVWHRARGRLSPADDPSTPLDIPLAAFVAFSLASITWSVDGEEGAVKAVFFYIPFLLLYLAVAAWLPRPRSRAVQAVTACTMGLGVAVAVLAVWQYQTREIFLNEKLQQANVYSRFFRANAIFYDPNVLGRYLAIAIAAVVALMWLRRDRPRAQIALGVTLIPLCAGLAVTFSRSSCMMLMTAMAIMAWWAFGPRRTLAVGGATLLILGGAAFMASGNVRNAATDLNRLEKVSEGRFDLMRGGVNIWQEAPLHGAGLGGFEVRYQQTLTPAEQRRIRVIISHNTPVTVLSELGLVGFALFGVLSVACVRLIRRAARRSPPVTGWAQWTMLALLVGIFVHALLYSALFEDPFTWTLASGALAAGLAAAAMRPGDGTPVSTGTPAVSDPPVAPVP